MAGKLNKHIFYPLQVDFKDKCHTLLIEAYYSSISDNMVKSDFEENDITAIIHYYIDNNKKRLDWQIVTNTENHLFYSLTGLKKGFAAKQPRIDLRYVKQWGGEEYKYYMEAKNLKAQNSSSKRRYIDTGINNFLSEGKYSLCDGFIVGYIMEGATSDSVKGINKFLIKDKREPEQLNAQSPILSIENYRSFHKEREILHLFLNYTS